MKMANDAAGDQSMAIHVENQANEILDRIGVDLASLAALHVDAPDLAAGPEDNRLAGLARARSAELNTLDNAQDERRGLLTALRSRIEQEGSEIDRLSAQEQDLARLIAELTSILSDYPITSEAPFSDLKGRLTWPVAGALLHDFGQPRASGKLKWNGVVLAAPVAYFAMNRWLDDFAYRVDMAWWIFVVAGLAALVIACLTVSYQAIKAAMDNPVKALRHE